MRIDRAGWIATLACFSLLAFGITSATARVELGDPAPEQTLYDLAGTAHTVGGSSDKTGTRFPFLRDGSSLVSLYDVAWHSLVIVDEAGLVQYLSEGTNSSMYQPEEIRVVLDRLLGRAAAARLKTWGAIKQLYEKAP
jgi:hypothetical protein